MIPNNFKEHKINTIETDFRAEVVTSSLIAGGQDPDKTLIIRKKGHTRNVSKDVDKIENEYSGYALVEYLYIYTNRESIYDSLPEGIFHSSIKTSGQKTKESIIQEIRKHRDEEFFARRYFQPFEMALDRILTTVQEYELKYYNVHFHNNLIELFSEHWTILKYLSTKQALLYMKIIPIMEHISGSFELTAKVMGIILDCTVTIKEGKKSKQQLDPKNSVPLGKWKLGIHAVIGKTIEYDDLDLVLTIGPISPTTMRLFKPGATHDLILKELIDLMIPFNRNTLVKYKIDKANTKFRLSTKDHKTYLGISTTL